MSLSKKNCSYIELNFVIPILDMPELVLECILEKLPPEGLYNMSSVCKSLREKCISDHLWVKHMNRKWGKVVGPAVYKEWKWQIASIKDPIFFNQINPKGLLRYISNLWPSTLVRYDSKSSILIKETSLPSPVDSVMSLYLVLETGKFWFPAQVYNRENGDAGFVVSCYDAELSYNPINDTFQARYPPHGNRSMGEEIGVKWDRLRASPIDIAPHDLHISDCLNDLCPGDHIEIQWRINTQFPYGWWYGVIGHLEPCFGNPSFCSCRQSETMVLEFNQYKMGSRWRTTFINRKEHREEGNEDVGFYGGIRKLVNYQDISTWKRFWPPQNLD